jgi:hypothetical protein
MISVRQEKPGAALDIPLHPDLAAIIAGDAVGAPHLPDNPVRQTVHLGGLR